MTISNLETTTLGGGCFWCLEAVFSDMSGVHSVESGYMGGHVPNPTYQQVCDGDTGHIEVARITFDPAVTSFRELLDVFFAIHDPTSRDRQGNDIGVQYRSVIFYHSEEQRQAAEESIGAIDASGHWGRPVVTELRPAVEFYPAEDYHRDYFAHNPNQPYCAFIVAPKLRKFRHQFPEKSKGNG